MAQKRGKGSNDKAKSTYRQSGRAEGSIKGPDAKGELDFAIGSHRLGKQVIEAEEISITFAGQTLVDQFSDLVVPGIVSDLSDRMEWAKRLYSIAWRVKSNRRMDN